MLEVLKDLARVVDIVVVIGAPNIRSFLGMDAEDNIAIIYRGSTGECKVITPVNIRKYVEQVASGRCTIIAYSYDIYPGYGYVLAKSFHDVILGTLKSMTRYGEHIGLPVMYVDAITYSVLSRFWKIVDISRDVRMIRAKKKYDELNIIIDVHNSIKRVIDECRKERQQVLEECFKRFLAIFDGVYIESLITTKNTYSLHLRAKKGIHRFSYRLTIPLDKDAENLISNINNDLERILKNYYTKQCINLVKTIKTHMQHQAAKISYVEVCGIGTEYCEYPTTSECLYENVYLTNEMAIKIEIVINETIFIPKLIVIRDGKAEVY